MSFLKSTNCGLISPAGIAALRKRYGLWRSEEGGLVFRLEESGGLPGLAGSMGISGLEELEEGVFRPLPMTLVTKGMFGMCNWAYQWYRDDGDMRPRDIAYLFWEILLNGVATEPTV